MLNNLFEVGWRWKNVDIICYMLTSLVYLQQGNVKKSKKDASIDEENLQIFRTTWGIVLKVSAKLKVTQKTGLLAPF